MSFTYAIHNASHIQKILWSTKIGKMHNWLLEMRETVSGRPSPRREEKRRRLPFKGGNKKFKSFNFQTLCPFLASEDRMLFDDMLCLEWSAFSFQGKRGGGRGWRPEQPTNYFSPRSDLPWRAVAWTFTFDQLWTWQKCKIDSIITVVSEL